MAFTNIDAESVYTTTGQPLQSDIEAIVQWMLQSDIKEAYQSKAYCWSIAINIAIDIDEMKTLKGLALADILRDVHAFIFQ